MTAEIPGLWRSLWRHRRAVLAGWDLWTSLAIAVAAALTLSDEQIGRVAHLAAAQLGVAAALLGVILAGLAIIVVFLSKEYLRVLARAEGGLEADLFPFWLTAALAVAAIVLSGVSTIFFGDASLVGRRVLTAFTTWFFLWTLFATLNLVAFVAAHGVTRSRQILQGDE